LNFPFIRESRENVFPFLVILEGWSNDADNSTFSSQEYITY